MKKLLLIISLGFIFNCFADWPDLSDREGLLDTMTKQERTDFLKSFNGKFFIPPLKKKGCFVLGALLVKPNYKGVAGMVGMAYREDEVGLVVDMEEGSNPVACELHVALLDGNKKLIKSVYMGDVEEEFEGELSVQLAMPWFVLQKIKYCKVFYK